MKWPWVSRERLEDEQRRSAALDAERVRLLDLLLNGAVPADRVATSRRVPKVAAVEEPGDELADEVAEAVADAHPTSGAEGFSTPFDRLHARFGQRFAHGGIPDQFRARAN